MSRAWHAWYKKFAPSSAEVRALYALEPADLPEWAAQLRQEFPTVPPSGVEMCHARWPETLDRLMDDIADATFRRRAHWCGDIPLETVAGLGLRRRVLIAWLQGVKRDKLLAELAEGLGAEPVIADLLFDVLGEVSEANTEVRQDIEFIADLFSGPYEAGNAPIFAKWKARLPELESRKSILADLAKSHYPVLTNLCNYRTLGDVDRLIGMISRQMISFDMLGPCNWSLKFVLQDEPERLSSSIAVVWALHRYAADEFQGEVQQTPLGVRDQCNALIKRLGHSDATRAWLAASLGFMVKKWVRRCWHIMEIEIPEDALPDFSFPNAPAVKAGADMTRFDGLKTEIRTKDVRHSVVSSSGASAGSKRKKAPSLGSLSGGSGAPRLPADGAEMSTSGAAPSLDASESNDSSPGGAALRGDMDVTEVEVEVETGADSGAHGTTDGDGANGGSGGDNGSASDGAPASGTGDSPDATEASGAAAESGTDVPTEPIADAPDAASSTDNAADADLERIEKYEGDEDDGEKLESGADWDAAVTVGGTTRVLSPGEAGHEGAEGDDGEPKRDEGD